MRTWWIFHVYLPRYCLTYYLALPYAFCRFLHNRTPGHSILNSDDRSKYFRGLFFFHSSYSIWNHLRFSWYYKYNIALNGGPKSNNYASAFGVTIFTTKLKGFGNKRILHRCRLSKARKIRIPFRAVPQSSDNEKQLPKFNTGTHSQGITRNAGIRRNCL